MYNIISHSLVFDFKWFGNHGHLIENHGNLIENHGILIENDRKSDRNLIEHHRKYHRKSHLWGSHGHEAWKDTVQLAAECLGEDGSEEREITEGMRMCWW